ncbi:Ribosomal protein L2 [Corchorus capsularis]|uniref:60S ribosomal protein L2, mitochondrial n=1 Tax=Corchorus capsularis TaxID=210143 RepID=A0A1R3GU16_COCAP|nr:Ribosomal protein L2 [Corchorus capsularis]
MRQEAIKKAALRQFVLGKGKSGGRNSAGRITSFHRGGGAKRLQRTVDVKRSTSSMGIVERIEYDPNRSSRLALVRWIDGEAVRQRKSITIDDKFPPPRKILEPATTTIRGVFSFSSQPGKVDQRFYNTFSPGTKAAEYVVVGGDGDGAPSRSNGAALCSEGAKTKLTSARDVFFSAPSVPEANNSSFVLPRVAVAGAKPAFFAPRVRDNAIGEKAAAFEVQRHSISSSKQKAAISWQDTLGLVGAVESKPKTVHGEKPKHRVDRAAVTYIIASNHLERGKMVMNCDWSSKPSTS